MSRFMLILGFVMLIASESRAATLRLEWGDVSTNAVSRYTSETAGIDIWVDLLSGEELTGVIFTNSPASDVFQVATSANAAGWSGSSLNGELGALGQQVSFASTTASDNLTGPGAFLIGTQTIRLDSPLPDATLDISIDHDTVLFLDETPKRYTWDARYNASYSGYVAYGDYGNEGWANSKGNGDQPEPNPLILLGGGSPDALAMLTPSRIANTGFTILKFLFTVGADSQSGAGFADQGVLFLEFPARSGGNRGFSQIDTNVGATSLGFLDAECSQGGITIRVVQEPGTLFDQASFTVDGADLQPGETITITYNTKMPDNAGTIFWRYKTDRNFDFDLEPIGEFDSYPGPAFTITGDDAAYIQLTAPADLVVDEEFTLAAVAFDQYGNVASNGTGGLLDLESTDSALTGLPETFDFATTNGIAEFPGVTYDATGFQRIFDAGSNSLPIYTNFSYVHATEPTYRRFFGDTHFHTGTGSNHRWDKGNGDHNGGYVYGQQAYAYARDAARLDFGSLSEHAESIPPEGWANAKALAEAVNTAGFTAFIAYEWTRSGNHQIVMYQSPEQELFDSTIGPYSVLVESLEPAIDDFMIIPHPMSFEPGSLMFQPGEIDERYSRVSEFHSDHANGPQEFELGALEDCGTVGCAQTNGVERNNTVQYAWGNSEGNKPHIHVGVVGSSDNHFQQPGLNYHTLEIANPGSLAAVLATQNDRNGIWDGLFERRTYGTTGPRIYLDFQVNSNGVGSGFVTTGDREFTIRVAGAEPLERVEVVRFVPDDPSGETYTELLSVDTGFANGGYTYENTTFVDADDLATLTGGEVFYYLRVFEQPQQEQGCASPEDSDCIPQGYALSSPIWVSVNDCNTNGIPDLLDMSNGAIADCNTNGIPDTCEIVAGSADDIDSNGVIDACEDCNTNGLPDGCDLAITGCALCNNAPGCGESGDCNVNEIPDECEVDCNANDVPDDCDIGVTTSTDCNNNHVPDECDIAGSTSEDCELDGVPDECGASRNTNDCQTNGFDDACDIAAGTSEDCNANGVPDECDPDCDDDGKPNDCEIAAGTATDCGGDTDEPNGIPDNCDIAAGTSSDLNGNGLPDVCEDCQPNDIPDECDLTCDGDCSGVSGCGEKADCDGNALPDDCQPDCDTRGVIDACECFPNDFDRDGDSDLQDYAFFQLCQTEGTPIGFNCSTFSDCDTNGTLDFASFRDATSNGGTTTSGFEIVAGPDPDRRCDEPAGGPGSGGFAAKILAPPDPPDWTYLEEEVSLEVRKLDGTIVTDALRPDSIYALHYVSATEGINFYLASIIAGSMNTVTMVAPAEGGDWTDVGSFLFAATAETIQEAPEVEGFIPSYRKTHLVINHMFAEPDRTASPTGRLFNFRTGRAGLLAVQVYLEAQDVRNAEVTSLNATISLTVEE